MFKKIHFKKKKLLTEAFVASFAVAFVFAAILPNVFAATAYYFPETAVELDGTNDGSVTISLNTPIVDNIYSIEGNFQTSDSTGNFILTELTPAAGISPSSNVVSDGRILWQDSTWVNPLVLGERESMWSATYVIDKDAPAGDYDLCLTGARIASESNDYDTHNYGNICASVAVTRSGGSEPGKPTQTILFKDAENSAFTSVTKRYGDEPFVVNVVTTEGEVAEYHPMDGPDDDHVVVTAPDSNMVTVGAVGTVEVCARVAETTNYAETTACYTVTVTKRPLDIVDATIRNKDYDGTTTATVDNVTFSDRNLATEQYEATGAFDNENAGNDKTVSVSVTLVGEAANNYVLNSSTYNGTASIAPLQLTDGDVAVNGGLTYTYTGSAITPTVTVTASAHGGTDTLVLDRDYEVAYSDNVNVGTGHIRVTGKGNFATAAPIVKDFEITVYAITESDYVSGPTTMVVGGSIDPAAFVLRTSGGYTLVKDTDYTVSIVGEGGNVGDTVNVTFSGTGNFSGGFGKTVTITDKEAQDLSFDGVAVGGTVVTEYGSGSFTHVATTTGDGVISYRSTNEAVATVNGAGEVTIVGVGTAEIIATAAETTTYAEGSASYNLTVLKKTITVDDVVVNDKTYDGTTGAEVGSATLSESSLRLGTDFLATAVFNNANVGDRLALVTITLGDDAFSRYCFNTSTEVCKNVVEAIEGATIEKFALNSDNTTAALSNTAFSYDGTAKEPTAVVTVDLDGDGTKEATLTAGTDYTISYSDNVSAGTAYATITGTGNYAGSLPALEFTISPAAVTDVVVTAAAQTYTGEALEPTLTVTGTVGGESKTFTSDDYTVVAHGNFVGAGDYTVTINGKAGSNYNIPTTSGTFTINRADSGMPPESTAELRIEAGSTLADLGERTSGFAWSNPDEVVTAGTHSYYASYIRDNDSANYIPTITTVPVYGLKRILILTAVNDGGEVTNPGGSAVEGDELTWTITPAEGYELRRFSVNLEGKTGEVTDGRFTMTAGTDNITAIAWFRRVYQFVDGMGQTHIRGVDGAAEFEIDADYDLFDDYGRVFVDGELVSSDNYDSWSGSTVISFHADYMDSLTVGEHTLVVEFDDGGIARTTFVIADPAVDDDDAAVKAGDTGSFTSVAGGVVVATGFTAVIAVVLVGVVYSVKKKK